MPESELRVVLATGGYQPTPQYQIIRNGRQVARLDLAIEGSKTAIEYDGRWHREPAQARLDRARRRWLEREGWHIVVVTAETLASDYQKILDEVRAADERHRSPC